MILAPLLMGYIVMSTVVYFIMNMLGEMTTYLPVRGVSVPYFISRFTEPSLGFAIGEP
jgi:amino acid transporter